MTEPLKARFLTVTGFSKNFLQLGNRTELKNNKYDFRKQSSGKSPKLRGRVIRAFAERRDRAIPALADSVDSFALRRGNHVFRVPLVDAKAQQSSTGKYPWSIEGSSSTFVYILNATEHPQKYLLQLNYPGGVYALGIKSIEAGQTVALDVRALRDNQIADESGHTIPLEATGGQLY